MPLDTPVSGNVPSESEVAGSWHRQWGCVVRFLSFALAAIAAIVFVLGVIVNFAGGRFAYDLAPVTLWRFSMACLGFAIYLNLYDRGRRDGE